MRRFVDEARAVNRIGHENIIDIFSFGQLADGRHYFVMEYLQGSTLGERLETGELPPAEIGPLLLQICDALEAAHAKKIVHRDLKLENVWIATGSRGQLTARLLDFGIAKLMETGEGTTTDVGVVMGTPQYMSPEQCHGRGVDHRTDIYAMGVMLYRVYAGCLPIQGATFAEILTKQLSEIPAPPSMYRPLPEALDRLILSCLEKDPARRPQSAGALGAALAALVPAALSAAARSRPIPSTSSAVYSATVSAGWAQSVPTPAAMTGGAESGSRWGLVGAGIVLTGLAAAGFVWFNHRAPASPDASSGVGEGATKRASGAIATPPPTNPKVIPPPPVAAPTPTPASSSAPSVKGGATTAKHHAAVESRPPPQREETESQWSKASSKRLATDNPFK